jgi:hypothetical protein
MVLIYNSSDVRKYNIGELMCRSTWAKSKNLISQLARAKRGRDMTQVVEQLLCKCKAMSTKHGNAKKHMIN